MVENPVIFNITLRWVLGVFVVIPPQRVIAFAEVARWHTAKPDALCDPCAVLVRGNAEWPVLINSFRFNLNEPGLPGSQAQAHWVAWLVRFLFFPCQVNNLNEKIKISELKNCLLELFSSYGEAGPPSMSVWCSCTAPLVLRRGHWHCCGWKYGQEGPGHRVHRAMFFFSVSVTGCGMKAEFIGLHLEYSYIYIFISN